MLRESDAQRIHMNEWDLQAGCSGSAIVPLRLPVGRSNFRKYLNQSNIPQAAPICTV